MKPKPGHASLIFFAVMIFSGCKKQNPLITDTPADYYPLQIGKYITYRMDSVKFINVGSQDTVISYLAKDVVEDSITDNLGRPSYRVIRYLSDTTGTTPWMPTIAYLVTPTGHSIEVVENNLRFIKLVTPVQDYVSWKGNVYIDTDPDDSSQVPYLDDWNYSYANTGLPYDVLQGTIPVTATVNEANETSGNVNSILVTTFSTAVYGKGLGLIYKKFLYSEYQPPSADFPAGATIGYGLTLNMVDHN